MAGSFFHLRLAERALPMVFTASEITDEVKAAFAAGAVGPDIGFFPGGPFAFSHRVHLERCGDFLRHLCEKAQNDEERAFAAGWGLHVYTDMAVHPWVEANVSQILDQGNKPAISDLWHMRLEWGIDCRFLAQEGVESLWEAQIHFPRRGDGSSLLGEVGTIFYGADADEDLLQQGALATARWLLRIPKILWWTGHTQRRGRKPNPWCVLLFTRFGRKVVGDWLELWPYFKDAAALARPLMPSQESWQRVSALGDEALIDFCRGWQEGFGQLGNLDLYRGEVGDD